MSLVKIGDACADLGPSAAGKRYVRVGTFFSDDDGRVVCKLDSLPLPGASWSGWINCFADRGKPAAPKSQGSSPPPWDDDDDIPF